MNNEIENIISHIQPFEDSEKISNFITDLKQQNKELIEALRLSNNCINHARVYLKNKTDFQDNGLYKLRVISNEELINNIT